MNRAKQYWSFFLWLLNKMTFRLFDFISEKNRQFSIYLEQYPVRTAGTFVFLMLLMAAGLSVILPVVDYPAFGLATLVFILFNLLFLISHAIMIAWECYQKEQQALVDKLRR